MEAERLKKIYGIYSYFYDHLFGRLYAPGRLRAIGLMDIRPGQEVLEVGVGTGISLPLYPRYARLVGIDLSREMLGKAWERKRSLGLDNVSLYEMDASRMDFPSGHFDKVIAAHIIALVPEPLKVLREMERVCKAGGELYILNYAPNGVFAWADRLFAPLRKAAGLGRHIDLELTLASAGLEIEHKERVNLFGSCCLIKCRK